MKKVQLKDKKFVETISSETIEQSVQRVADQINTEMAGFDLFLCAY